MLSKVRSLIVTFSFQLSIAVTALFFSNMGAAPSDDSPPECSSQNPFRAAFVGLLSSVIKALPILLLRHFHKRQFHRRKEGWTPDAKERRGLYLRMKDRIQTIAVLVLGAFLTLFNISFLANTTKQVQLEVAISFAADLCWSMLLFPLILALFHVLLAEFALARDLNLLDLAQVRFELSDLSDGNQGAAGASVVPARFAKSDFNFREFVSEKEAVSAFNKFHKWSLTSTAV